MDEPAVGFILGILLILLGIYAINEYVNAGGQRGAEIMVYAGSIWIFGGLVNNVYITICWLKKHGQDEKE